MGGQEVAPHVQSVLLVLANFADDSGGNVFPSIGRIAWQTGYSERQVYRIMGELKKAGTVRLTRRAHANHPAHYRLALGGVPRKPDFCPQNRDDDPDTLTVSDAPVAGVTPSRHT